MEVNLLTFGIAFGAGLLSFASPCCLPLVPAYLSYITGVSIDQFSQEQVVTQREQIVLSAIVFVVGLALVFTLLGASASVIGQALAISAAQATDAALFSANPASAIAPAGVLHGVTAIPSANGTGARTSRQEAERLASEPYPIRCKR